MKYITCPYCGAHLDHNEKCDCQKRDRTEGNKIFKTIKKDVLPKRPRVYML